MDDIPFPQQTPPPGKDSSPSVSLLKYTEEDLERVRREAMEQSSEEAAIIMAEVEDLEKRLRAAEAEKKRMAAEIESLSRRNANSSRDSSMLIPTTPTTPSTKGFGVIPSSPFGGTPDDFAKRQALELEVEEVFFFFFFCLLFACLFLCFHTYS